jgi:hypothetical protein
MTSNDLVISQNLQRRNRSNQVDFPKFILAIRMTVHLGIIVSRYDIDTILTCMTFGNRCYHQQSFSRLTLNVLSNVQTNHGVRLNTNPVHGATDHECKKR